MYEKLYEDNKGLLWYWAQRYKPPPGIDVEDLVQTGFFGLVDAHRSYKRERGKWSTWASMYIRNEMRLLLGVRGKKHIEQISLDVPIREDGASLGDLMPDGDAPELDSGVIQDELVKGVRGAVNAIEDPLVRNVIKCIYLKEMSYTAAADALGIEKKDVSLLAQKGKDRLRIKLRHIDPDLDLVTKFHAHKGVQAFQSDLTSTVEAAVLWRENQRRLIK
ncbi:MAG: sigma-70 family RNA polymerase sigma factor [Oscillospiraceae bacterium]|nr:sigma-70 family RNA polymerase sigma factor [Oscillospiraceae bacterium]